MIFVDAGKPPVNPFVQMIGKPSSVRGTQIPKYDPTGQNGYMAKRGFYDLVVEGVIGWNEKASLLERCYSLIEEGMRDKAVAKKIASINGTKKYLEDAILASSKGLPADPKKSKAVGCFIE